MEKRTDGLNGLIDLGIAQLGVHGEAKQACGETFRDVHAPLTHPDAVPVPGLLMNRYRIENARADFPQIGRASCRERV